MKIVVDKPMILIAVLSALAPGCSKSKLREWLKYGRVLVDGQVVKVASTPLHQGQVVALSEKSQSQSIGAGLRIVYADAELVVVDKPAGLLSVAKDKGGELSAHRILKQHYHPMRVYPVHRLDKMTSGLMLFALGESSREKLKKLFETRDVKRIYEAVVEGIIAVNQGVWDSLLFEDGNLVMRTTDDPSIGKRAITHYRLIAKSKNHSLLELHLKTGRKNQIRVHSAQAGHPVSGDKKYGAKDVPAKRMCLHAKELQFVHPFSGKRLCFTSPVPSSFYKVVPSGKRS